MTKNNLQLATEIVIAMLNTNHISKNANNKIDNNSVTKALEDVYKKLEQLDKVKTENDTPIQVI